MSYAVFPVCKHRVFSHCLRKHSAVAPGSNEVWHLPDWALHHLLELLSRDSAWPRSPSLSPPLPCVSTILSGRLLPSGPPLGTYPSLAPRCMSNFLLWNRSLWLQDGEWIWVLREGRRCPEWKQRGQLSGYYNSLGLQQLLSKAKLLASLPRASQTVKCQSWSDL